MGSLISGVLESMARLRPAPTQAEMSTDETIDEGLTKAVKDFDSRFPPEWRLSKKGRAADRVTDAADDRTAVGLPSSSTSRPGSPARTAPSSSPTAAPRSSRSSRPRAIRCAAGRRRAPRSPPATTARCSPSCRRRSRAWSPTPTTPTTSSGCARCWRGPTRWCGRSGSRLAEHPALAPDAIRRAAPHLHRHDDHAVRPRRARGATGPPPSSPCRPGRAGSSGSAAARPDRAPVFVGGQIGEWLTGAYAAIGTMASRARAPADGAGELVDVSMLETLAMCLTYYPVTYFDMVGRPFRSGRSIVDARASRRTSDGLVGLGRRDRPAVARLLRDGRPPRVDGGPLALRQPRPPAAGRSRRGWPSTRPPRSSSSPARSASRTRRSATARRSPRPTTSAARGSIVDNPRDGFVEPDRPYRFDPPLLRAARAGAPRSASTTADAASRGRRRARRPRTAADGPLPFDGLRVLDLTAFWAGPLVHARAGDARRRGAPPRVDGPPRRHPPARRPALLGARLVGALRHLLRAQHQQEERDPRPRHRARAGTLLRRLIATCDVIVENYTPRVLEQLGLDVDAVRAIRPDVVMVRMPGFGLDGPWRDDPAFAFVIEDAAGLTWMTGLPRPEPDLALLRRRLERRHPRAVRAAARARAPAAHRRGRRSSRRRWSTPRSTSPPSR